MPYSPITDQSRRSSLTVQHAVVNGIAVVPRRNETIDQAMRRLKSALRFDGKLDQIKLKSCHMGKGDFVKARRRIRQKLARHRIKSANASQ